MRRYFNTEGACNPKKHYMVNLDARLKQIKEQYVDRGSYFVINRGRQYGKTTTLQALREYLREEYIPVFLDFQGIGTAEFQTEALFSKAFSKLFTREIKRIGVANAEEIESRLEPYAKESAQNVMSDMFEQLSLICENAEKPIVLLIDEVDSASNNHVFLDFLALLRQYYLVRDDYPTFQSVILAGVYDIKNLKSKIRLDEQHKYNSPWNIAADFMVRMSLSEPEIAGMLEEYETDNHIGMDVAAVAHEIFAYTSGYPYLVSRICKLLDEVVAQKEGFEDSTKVWSRDGIDEAIKLILNSKAPLFESMTRQLYEHQDMKQMLQQILLQGRRLPYNAQNELIDLATMFGYIENKNGIVQIANRIFETCLYNLFITEDIMTNAIYGRAQENISQFVDNGRLNMDKVIEKFTEYFTDIYGDNDEKFIENYGRKFFLLYLKPIINGTGNYYIEAQTRDSKRTDVIVDYRGEQFVIEMKIWRGNEYNERGETQLAEYLEYYHKDKGYMVSFNFNRSKQVGTRTITVGDKTILEAVV